MTIRFHDVSHYQGDYHPSGPTIAKATQGLGNVDLTYARNRDRTVAGGWPFAGYHYLTTDDTGGQALHALNVVGRSTPLMVDVEDGSGSLAHLLAFIAAYRRLGGLLTLVYVPRWYWEGTWGSPSLAPLAATGVALISSAYPHAGYSDTGVGWQPYGGMHPVIWQYTDSPIDTNAFRGTEAELRALFTGTHTPTGDVPTMALTAPEIDAIAAATVTKLLATQLGASGPNVETALQLASSGAVEVHTESTSLAALLASSTTLGATIAGLPAAVVAALPPSTGGTGATATEVEQAVHDGLATLRLTTEPPAAPAA